MQNHVKKTVLQIESDSKKMSKHRKVLAQS